MVGAGRLTVGLDLLLSRRVEMTSDHDWAGQGKYQVRRCMHCLKSQA